MTAIDTQNTDNISNIQNFYRDKTIFITGGTGFFGNILLEKLLRSCPDLKRLYVLTRDKKGKDAKERFEQIFDNELFDRMKTAYPDYLSKLTPITGDCKKPNLGISENDRNILFSEVEIIFHMAATVRFDAHLRDAVNTNVRATNDLLDLAHSMKKLTAFVYVSTAYSNCAVRETISEKFYTPPISPENLLKATDIFPDEILERITPHLIVPWPNTYIFTKAIAEDIVRSKGKDIPTTVVRPATVIATANEPIAGWINNFYGPTGVVAGAGIGLLRSVHADGECIANLVPGDKVMNAIIVSAWDIARTWSQKSEKIIKKSEGESKPYQDSQEIPILNYVSSNSNPLKWKDFMKHNEIAGADLPSMLAIWVYSLTLNKYRFVHQIYCIFLHLLPAIIIDTCARIVGKEPKLWNIYKKIHRVSDIMSYFSTKQWKFDDSNTMQLCDKLTKKDQELFDFDLRKLNWTEYFYHHIRGLRVYLVHDKMETLEKARKKHRRLLIAHYTLKTIIYGLLLYAVISILKWIF